MFDQISGHCAFREVALNDGKAQKCFFPDEQQKGRGLCFRKVWLTLPG